MPDSTLPKWARTIARILRGGLCVFAVLVGFGDLIAPSQVVKDAAGPHVVQTWALTLVLAGTVAVCAVVLHRWRWEMITVSLLALALAARAVAVWLSVADGERIAAAAGISIAALTFLLRTVDLMVFAAKASAGLRLYRRRAGA